MLNAVNSVKTIYNVSHYVSWMTRMENVNIAVYLNLPYCHLLFVNIYEVELM